MDPIAEETFEYAGRTWVRNLVTASMQIVPKDKLPKAVASESDDATDKFYWQDGINPDLCYVKFLLDTEGGNENWDYMPRPSLRRRFATARFKPMDMEHIVKESESMVFMDKSAPPVTNTIFGVMTSASLSDAEGNLLSEKEIADLDNTDDFNRPKKDRLGVVGYGALYNFLFPKTTVDTLVAASEGMMKVSMERWISNYDFIYTDNQGNLASASKKEAEGNGLFASWATRTLWNDNRVWRRSLDFVYGGVASTTNPANKLSVYLPNGVSKATASVQENDPVLKKLLNRHSELHAQFAVSPDDNQNWALVQEHKFIHECLAQYKSGK